MSPRTETLFLALFAAAGWVAAVASAYMLFGTVGVVYGTAWCVAWAVAGWAAGRGDR